MYEIRVHFDNGDHIDTRLNGGIDTIVHYYLDRKFPFLDESGREYMSTARCVEFLNDIRIPWNGIKITATRVFSLSDAYMRRWQLYYRFRVEFVVHYPTGVNMKSGAAYAPGMFG